jgi:Tn3 transposase DDE domain
LSAKCQSTWRTIRARHLERQTEQAWCLTLATSTVIAWTTEYYGFTVEQNSHSDRRMDDEVLACISPAFRQNINFFGAIEVDIDADSQLGHRVSAATRPRQPVLIRMRG